MPGHWPKLPWDHKASANLGNVNLVYDKNKEGFQTLDNYKNNDN